MRPIEPERVRRLLVRGTNWVGDAVMSIPALREIRRRFRKARISLLVKPWVRDVYSAVDFIDEILIFQRPGAHEGWLGMLRLVADLRTRQFDTTILLQNAMEAALIALWSRIPIRIGYARDGRGPLLTHPVTIDPAVKKYHQVYYYLGILAGAGLITARPWARGDYVLDPISISVLPADQSAALAILRAHGIDQGDMIIGINPGAAYGGAKRWPAERFAAVADALSSRCGARIVVFGSPSDERVAREVGAKMTGQPVILAGRTTLGQLMGLLRLCRLFITNDSGPMHLAAALDVPQLAIFGSTSEVATGPLNEHARILKNQVDCNPCFLRECPTDFRCMLGISVEQVVEAAQASLAGAALDGRKD